MNNASTIFCLERRAGIERRRYSYDSHIPDRRTAEQHRSEMDRRKRKSIDPNRMIEVMSQEN